MAIEVKVPLLPESVTDATVSTWHKKAGDRVTRDENIVDLETDKVMLEVPAPSDGVIKEIIKQTGSTVQANEILAIIEAVAAGSEEKAPATKPAEVKAPAEAKVSVEAKPQKAETQTPSQAYEPSQSNVPLSPSARRMMAEQGDTGMQKQQPKQAAATSSASVAEAKVSASDTSSSHRAERRVPMTRIRTRIAERLLEVTQSTAMLTTFNEINMSAVMEMRNRYRERFEKKYKVRLGFMSFFVRAVVEALKRSPIVNASIDGNDIVYHGYFDIGVAVSTERGLVVPVLRDADKMSMAEIESKIAEYAEKARTGKLAIEDMQGGTFTITNGGVFGSLMATPIINAPQCAILGMHKIQERPVAENGQVVIRPMMYVALSYDHRIIDGKESVTFLVSIKEMLEDPARLILDI